MEPDLTNICKLNFSPRRLRNTAQDFSYIRCKNTGKEIIYEYPPAYSTIVGVPREDVFNIARSISEMCGENIKKWFPKKDALVDLSNLKPVNYKTSEVYSLAKFSLPIGSGVLQEIEKLVTSYGKGNYGVILTVIYSVSELYVAPTKDRIHIVSVIKAKYVVYRNVQLVKDGEKITHFVESEHFFKKREGLFVNTDGTMTFMGEPVL